jgi:hypothetical protein
MSLSLYDVTVPAFLRGLRVLSTELDKGAAHAAASGTDPTELVTARLAPDMLTLAGQVQRACDTSKLSVERLSGVASPRFEDNETSIAQLQARIAGVIAYIEGVAADTFTGAETKTITLKFGPMEQHFTGTAYALTFALPNFYFHVATLHDILRHKGVAVGKRDYLGAFA